MKIGLLGGSFNPPHEGHLSISEQALEILKIDQIWWLVSPQNPNKPSHNMASFDERFSLCENITKHNGKIIISDFEHKNNSNVTINSLKALLKNFDDHQFLWIMGADNLNTFHHWRNWQDILEIIPIAVVDRDNYKKAALNSKAATEFIKYKVDKKDIFESGLPKWCFLDIEKHPASSTKIRNSNI